MERADENTDDSSNKPFACHICLDTASEPVVTVCGHLFCWPCLSQWIKMPGGDACPVCKAGLKKESVVPIYGKGGNSVDPREATEARPNAQRPEREPQSFFSQFNTGGFTVAFGPAVFSTVLGMQGFGVFPNHHQHQENQNLTPEQLQQQERELFARMMFFMGILVLLTVFMA